MQIIIAQMHSSFSHFRQIFLTDVTVNFEWKNFAFKLTSIDFLREKYTRFFIRNQVTKGLTLKMV